MALETASYIDGLVATNPVGSDPLADADGHIRLVKSALKATFPNITGPVTATQDSLNSPLPSGGIILWSGAIAAVPSGWLLCDGGSGTPDLRDRFVVGAGLGYVVGATGGSATVVLETANLPVHSHTFSGTAQSNGSHAHSGSTNNTGSHQHNIPTSVTGDSFGKADVGGGGSEGTLTTDPAGAHQHTITTDTQGAHTHTLEGTVGDTGSATAVENRPPYYALAYIMKI
jgi:microcystin-dependent protein